MASTSKTGLYAGTGQVDIPANTADPSALSAFSLGGVRVWPLVSAGLQCVQLLKNVELARKYYDKNHEDFVFWNEGASGTGFTGYKGYMGNALDESKVRPYYSRETYQPQFGALDYIASTGRGQSKSSLHLDREWLNTRRKIGRYNVGHGRRIDYKYASAKLNSELEGWNLGFRFEDHRKMLYDEQRHAHQVEILNLGLGFGNSAREGLATSVKALSEARSQKAGQFGSLANGLSTYSGQRDAAKNFEQQMYNRKGLDIGPPKELAGPVLDTGTGQ